jgi:hypothetical protein
MMVRKIISPGKMASQEGGLASIENARQQMPHQRIGLEGMLPERQLQLVRYAYAGASTSLRAMSTADMASSA